MKNVNEKFHEFSGGMSVWVLVAAAAVILGLYALSAATNEWVFFIALGLVTLGAVLVLRARTHNARREDAR